MGIIAIACNLLLGYSEHRTVWFLLVLPVIVSISFFLIADIDSPRTGTAIYRKILLLSSNQ
jgi:hypothetical protein